MNTHMTTDPAAKRRRWLLPLVILCAAGAIAIWGSAREAAKIQQVETAVRSLCRDAAAGRDVSMYFDASSDSLRERAVDALRLACPRPELADVMDVIVKPGDSTDAGQSQGAATHTATIRANNRELIILRVRYVGEGRIHVIGYSAPQTAATDR